MKDRSIGPRPVSAHVKPFSPGINGSTMATGHATPGMAALQHEITALRAQLAQRDEVIRAIRCGEVDAFLVSDARGARVRTLEGAESGYRALVEAMSEGAALLRDDGITLYCNGRLAAMLRAPATSVIGGSLLQFATDESRAALEGLLAEHSEGSRSGDAAFCRFDGTELAAHVSLSPVRMNGSRATCVLVVDLTDRVRMERELRTLSLFDELTGLLNRRGFLTLAEQQVKSARRLGQSLHLAFADLDGMKTINDTLGHCAGDRALTEAAAVLRRTFRESDLIARLGGDEFAVLAMVDRQTDVTRLADRLQRRLQLHNVRGRLGFRLEMSVGVVTYGPEAAASIEELLSRADTAMYRQKRLKKQGPVLHDEQNLDESAPAA
jgi:diguanylate cyclase (GGDEF)-like protein/PAS domain S-box-containing protein